jgi:hypothetical protein
MVLGLGILTGFLYWSSIMQYTAIKMNFGVKQYTFH